MSTHDIPDSDYLRRHPELLEELEQSTQPAWTIEHRDRVYNETWLLGIHLYMQALHAAGYPAPSFDYWYSTEGSGEQQNGIYRIRLAPRAARTVPDLTPSPRICLAQALAEYAHDGQTDRQGVPYIHHIRRVYSACVNAGLDEDQQIAAILHDTPEQIDIYPNTIEDLFGKSVRDMVYVLTRLPGWTYKEYIDRLLTHPRVLPVKLADLRDNLDETRGSIPTSLRQRYTSAVGKITRAMSSGDVGK